MAIGAKLNPTLRAFIEAQPLFFVATAAAEGRVNLSPKGLDTLRILDNDCIVWMNLSGSGNETAAHVAENGRMTLMFCAFDGAAMILRVYGQAQVLHPGGADGTRMASLFESMPGARQVFELSIDLTQTSCGTGVPRMRFQAERGDTELLPFFEEMGEDGVRDYWERKNKLSLDGKPTGL